MTKCDRKFVLELVRSQSLEGVLVRSLKYGLDHREADALVAQDRVQRLERREPMRMAATAPVLECEQDLWSCAQIRQLERRDLLSVGANPPLHAKLRCLSFGHVH